MDITYALNPTGENQLTVLGAYGGRGSLVHSQFISFPEGGSQSLSVREVSCSSGTGDDVVQQDTGRTVTSSAHRRK